MILRFTPDLSYHWLRGEREGRLPWRTRYFLEMAPESEAVEAAITVEALSP